MMIEHDTLMYNASKIHDIIDRLANVTSAVIFLVAKFNNIYLQPPNH